MRVADVGAGAGYFAFKLSSLVGDGGQVYATETDPDMVRHLEKEKKKRGNLNLQVVHVDGRQRHKLQLKPLTVDVILLVNLFYPFYNSMSGEAEKFLAECHAALVSGGRVVLTNDKIRPSRGECAKYQEHLCGDLLLEAVKELAQKKFEIVKEHIIGDSFDEGNNEGPGYLLVLKKREGLLLDVADHSISYLSK